MYQTIREHLNPVTDNTDIERFVPSLNSGSKKRKYVTSHDSAIPFNRGTAW
jgi:hypothetical protein